MKTKKRRRGERRWRKDKEKKKREVTGAYRCLSHWRHGGGADIRWPRGRTKKTRQETQRKTGRKDLESL